MIQINNVKYFRPQLEDFYPGFQYEVVIAGGRTTVRDSYRVGTLIPFNVDRSKGVFVSDTVIVPYLTAGQIEATGFFRINTPPFMFHQTGSATIQWFQRDRWIISFNEETRMMGIFTQSASMEHFALFFSGVCRCINRFKLLISMITDNENSTQIVKQIEA